ncbi:MAG: ComF family protein [Ignavibacteria bacterium]|nr:ComF family protein [Ignavibacteria bacterium]
MKKILKEISGMYESILEFIYPPSCILSDEYISNENSNRYIKDDRFNLLFRISDKDKIDLKNKLMSEYSFSVFTFYERDDFSKIIYNIKYGGMRKLAVYMGEILGLEFMKTNDSNNFPEFDMIVPVPLHRSRQRERGFNQSKLISTGMSNITGIKVTEDLLIRVKNTSSQTRLNKLRRKLNIENAFEINSKYLTEINEKNIIILDDVITTGSTINEAVKILKQNGAGEIMCCSLAMARD